MTLQIFWPKPGNPREGGQQGGRGREGGSRAKPGNQLVDIYILNLVLLRFYYTAGCFTHFNI